MSTDALYDLAFRFRKTRLWKQLYDTQLFAVRHSDGTLGYCSVMGMLGEHLALAVYPDMDGLATYRMLSADREGMNPFDVREIVLAQECLSVAFENKSDLRAKEQKQVSDYCASHGIRLRGKNACPHFERFRPHYFPWYMDDPADQLRMQEALEAALHVSERLASATPQDLGFTEGAPYDRSIPLLTPNGDGFDWTTVDLPAPQPMDYPAGRIADDLGLAKLAKSRKRRSGEWACNVFMHLDPVTDEDSDNPDGRYIDEPINAPYFPFVFIVVDTQTGRVISIQLANGPDDYAETFAREILKLALDSGRPTRIRVKNDRTYALMEKIASQLGATLVMEDRIDVLDEAVDGLRAEFDGSQGGALGGVAAVIELLRDPQALEAIPDDVLEQLLPALQGDTLPQDVGLNILSELRRRGMI